MNKIMRAVAAMTVCLVTVTMVCSEGKGASAVKRDLRKSQEEKRSGTVSKDGITVRFNKAKRNIEISESEAGLLLHGGVVRARTGKVDVSSDSARSPCRITVNDSPPELRLDLADALAVVVRIGDNGTVSVLMKGEMEGAATFQADAATGQQAMLAILNDQKDDDAKVLFTALGPAEVQQARSLFDPEHDLAMTADAPEGAHWRWAEGWRLRSSAAAGEDLLSLRIRRHYYRDELNIKYYTPIRKRSRWGKAAPIVAMMWYGITQWEDWEEWEGWEVGRGKFGQKKEWLYPQADWLAEHLLPYADTLVFQLDANYAKYDDKYMREISDYIRSKGLTPGIWVTPYAVAPEAVADEHPDWFLRDANGELLLTFGWRTYAWEPAGPPPQRYRAGTINVNKPEAVREWYGMWWHKISDTWNFDFFKIDGQPPVIGAYQKAVNGEGMDGYRKGLEIARSIVGPEKFINGCWGIPLNAIGLLDGSRTGGDTGRRPHAIDVIVRWNFLNNVVWWCDPDAAGNLYRTPVGRARLNSQARVLTGQQFLTDDWWTKAPPAVRRVWQQSFPMLDIRPVNLYRIDNWQAYDMFDLRIVKPWGTWDVVGLFNYSGQPVQKDLDLSRLNLEADQVHVFEYWSSTYLGRLSNDARISRRVEAYDGHLFSIVPDNEHYPSLLSTNRHLSQGGLDLESINWKQTGDEWTVSGRSGHLVRGDEYELIFFGGRYGVKEAKSSAGTAVITSDHGLARVGFLPKRSGAAEWQITFEPLHAATMETAPESIDLSPGRSARIGVTSLGLQGFQWTCKTSDSRIRVTPQTGLLGPWPDQVAVTVTVDASNIAKGTVWDGNVRFIPDGRDASGRKVAIRLIMPPPENLARSAKASASSVFGKDFAADCLIDGDTSTRWNSARGDTDGAWVELVWERPVTFSRVVINEAFGGSKRIQVWRLEADDKTMREIGRGKEVGDRLTVDLPDSVTARRLRLTIEKALNVPTICELEVYDWPRK